MDDFQVRLVLALERLSGREGPGPGEVLVNRLDALLLVLEDIRDRLPADPAELQARGRS